MSTINISIPPELKKQVEKLIECGFYTSFSDACRDGLRKIVERNAFDDILEISKREKAAGQKAGLTDEETEEFFSSLE